MSINFRLLGLAEVIARGRTIVLPSTKPSVVLATLLLQPNEFVPRERLFETLWGQKPPSSARSTLHTNVMRIRQLLGREHAPALSVRTLPGGYTIDASADTVDLLRFRRLVDRARRHSGDLEEESRCLNEALALWRGPALANIPSEALQREVVPMLTEEWLEATERWLDIELQLGRLRNHIADMRALTSAYPYREHFWEQLVEALYRSGRQTEAVEEQRRVKDVLRNELGIDPGPGLQRLELAILRGESLPAGSSEANGSAENSSEAATDTPDAWCQLPSRVPDFVGRSKTLGRIADEVTAAVDSSEPAVTVIQGTPGTGKSALAVWVAHEVRRYFPDGQWYARLTDTDGTARSPADVATQLLRAAATNTRDIPSESASPGSMLQAAIAGKRVLLLLDDAMDPEQVRPLLPGTAGSAVLVTSRASLMGLAVLGGVRYHKLDALPMESAIELLSGMLGREVVTAEQDAAAGLAEKCGRLPLALRIAAARLTNRPNQSLSDYLAWLTADPLSRLSVGRHRSLCVLRAFDVSYERLSAAAQRMFRLIGDVCCGSTFTVHEIANATGSTVTESEQALDELFDTGMLQSHALESFSMPPLLHLYAAVKAQAETG